jgi:putative DNA primase/helicase
MSANAIGRALNGRQSVGGWLVRCPCPNHGQGRGDRTPSLSVSDGDEGRLLLKCFAGCTFEDILAELQRLGLVDDRQPRSSVPSLRKRAPPSVHRPDEAALKIWREAETAENSAVQEYLERRGILSIPPSIRWGRVFHLGRVQMPVMVAAVQRPDDGVIVATQTTILTHKGTKASVSVPKVTHGALGAGAFRGGPASEVMGIAEGVETALSAQLMSGVSVWASLGASRLHRVELPSIVREVHIFADNDEPGRAAADQTAKAHAALGRRVLLRFPPSGMDYNDLLNADADERLEEIVTDGFSREVAA